MQINANFDVILTNATFWQFFCIFWEVKSDSLCKIKKIWNIYSCSGATFLF